MNVLITGASRGIGLATVERCRAEGHRVAGIARDVSAIEWRCDATRSFDLRSAVEVEQVVPWAESRLGALDAVIACAGDANHRSLENLEAESLDAAFALHVRAPILLARDFVRSNPARSGVIITVASTLALEGVPGTVAYASAKAALIAASRTLAVELAPRVRVCCVVPGGVDTDMVQERAEHLRQLHPLGRLARPEEISDAILFLLKNEFVTGSILTIDGGLTAAG